MTHPSVCKALERKSGGSCEPPRVLGGYYLAVRETMLEAAELPALFSQTATT